jgi:hypothetical protein
VSVIIVPDRDSISTYLIYKIYLYLSSKPPRSWTSWPVSLGRVGRLMVGPAVPLPSLGDVVPMVPNLVRVDRG